jgi:metal-dependent amidase/aminoacylase/carboxypeptidase family protein
MYGDDFSHYGKIMPAGFFFVGAEIKGDRRKHHDAHFDIDESCMPVAVAVLAETVLRMVR